jgi:hypothetical protein
MGIPTTWRDCSLSSAALERIELMVGKCANRIRGFPFHGIRYSGTRQLWPFARWCKTRTALSSFAPSPKINSVRSIAGAQTPGHASSSNFGFPWEPLIRGVSTV